ncbi:MAG: hypothetical protein AAB368_15865, partial [bacterium]
MRSDAALAALLAIVTGLAGARVRDRGEELRRPRIEGQRPLRVWAAEGLSARKILMQKAYIDLLQYVGEGGYGLDHGDGLVRLAARATDFDPRFPHLYMTAGALLMWTCRRPADAARLLEKGIAYNPGAGRLRLYLAAFVYRQANRMKEEIAV